MKKEKACGCIIKDNDKVLLILEKHGNFWGFPKGHVENGESEVETAQREVKEETNLDVIIDDNKRYVINYIVDNKIDKEVVLFNAKLKSSNVMIQEEEIKDYKWFSINEAINILPFDNLKEVLKKSCNK